ncbi:MAG: protease inhibitor I42 family protein [Phycisphaerae bacterium]
MRIARGPAVLVSVVLAALAGCPAGNHGASAPAAEIELTAADDGGAIEVADGATIRLTLSANDGLGLEWFITQLDSEIVEFRDREQTLVQIGDPTVEPATERWFFRAVRPGTTTLQLLYLQNQDATLPVDSFQVTITVTAASSIAGQ